MFFANNMVVFMQMTAHLCTILHINSFFYTVDLLVTPLFRKQEIA